MLRCVAAKVELSSIFFFFCQSSLYRQPCCVSGQAVFFFFFFMQTTVWSEYGLFMLHINKIPWPRFKAKRLRAALSDHTQQKPVAFERHETQWMVQMRKTGLTLYCFSPNMLQHMKKKHPMIPPTTHSSFKSLSDKRSVFTSVTWRFFGNTTCVYSTWEQLGASELCSVAVECWIHPDCLMWLGLSLAPVVSIGVDLHVSAMLPITQQGQSGRGRFTVSTWPVVYWSAVKWSCVTDCRNRNQRDLDLSGFAGFWRNSEVQEWVLEPGSKH